jgi:hypothetical protein
MTQTRQIIADKISAIQFNLRYQVCHFFFIGSTTLKIFWKKIWYNFINRVFKPAR